MTLEDIGVLRRDDPNIGRIVHWLRFNARQFEIEAQALEDYHTVLLARIQELEQALK